MNLRSILKAIRVVLVPILVVFVGFIVYSALTGFGSDRAKSSMFIRESRDIGRQLEKYKEEYGTYPPAGTGGSVYTFISAELLAPVPLFTGDLTTTMSSPSYLGPPVDPYRKIKLFDGESKGTARYSHPRDSEAPFPYFSGYPPRYYRNASGDFYLLISNGLDEKAGLNQAILDKLSPSFTTATLRKLEAFAYDPTNGGVSGGDFYRTDFEKITDSTPTSPAL